VLSCGFTRRVLTVGTRFLAGAFFFGGCNLAFPIYEGRVTGPASDGGTVHGDETTGPSSTDEGASSAASCAPAYPDLLKGYPVKPPWKVAGVDYCAGYAEGLALKNPNTIGTTQTEPLYRDGNEIVVNGNGVTIDGYDFSLDGGWRVRVIRGDAPVIQNSRFAIDPTSPTKLEPIVFFSKDNDPSYWGGGAIIRNNVFIGHGATTGYTCLLCIYRPGDYVIQHNWIKDGAYDWISAGGNGAAITYDVRYNLLENAGLSGSGSSDWFETYSDKGQLYDRIAIDYNTIVQTSLPVEPGTTIRGMTLDGNPKPPFATFGEGSFSHNTVVVTVNGMQFVTRIDLGETKKGWTIDHNYVDAAKLPSPLFAQSNDPGALHGTVTITDNLNLATGNPLQ
jgi:hypothetical protein